MSGDEDTELRDLVAQTLENNGVLSKIRAELRASVYLAFDDHHPDQSQLKFANKKLNSFMKTNEGMVTLSLVREFLKFLSLDFTLSVFDPECSADAGYTEREDLLQQFDIHEPQDLPVLSLLLKGLNLPEIKSVATVKNEQGDSVKTAEEQETKPQDNKSQENKTHENKTQENKAKPVLNGKRSVPHINETPTLSGEKSCLSVPLSDKSFTIPEKSPDEKRKDEVKTINTLTQTIQSLGVSNSKSPESNLLGVLPPLMAKTNDKTFDNIKAIMEPESPNDSLDNYDEDFQSSASVTEQGKVGGSVSEEIEDEVVSDAQSSDSAVDGDQELTLDNSVTDVLNISADHLEDA